MSRSFDVRFCGCAFRARPRLGGFPVPSLRKLEEKDNRRLLFLPGYAFLLFQEETSVQALIDACMEEDGKLYLCVSSPTIKDKPVSGGGGAVHGDTPETDHDRVVSSRSRSVPGT